MNKYKEAKQFSSIDIPKQNILAEQTSQISAAVINAIIATFINAFILVNVLWSVIAHDILLIWLAATVLISLLRGITAYQYKKAAPPLEKTHIWTQRFFIGNLLASLAWGASAIWLFPEDELAHQVFLAFVIGGMSAGAVVYLSHIKIVIYSYLSFSLIPLLMHFFYSNTVLGNEMGIMITLYLLMMYFAANRTHSNLKQNICLRLENIEREYSLQNSERRYETLLETATDAFFLHNLDGKFLDVNQQACRNLGYTRDELLNMSVSDIQDDHAYEKLKLLYPKLEEGKSIQLEGFQRRKDGTTFPVEVSVGLVNINKENLLSVFAHDVTKRKQTNEIIRNSQQRMALHIQRTPLAVIEWDESFCITQWNHAAENIFGFTESEALGRHAKEIIVPDDEIEHIDNIWEQLLTLDSGTRSTNENITKNGNTILCDWYNTPLINEAGETIGVASLAQDITKQKNAELALIEAKEQAESANKAKSRFLASMSHELRTPMNAVLGFTQLLLLKATDEATKQNIKEIINAGNDLLELINQVLDLSKIESGITHLFIGSHNLNDLLNDSLLIITPIADKQSVVIDNNVDLTKNIKVNVDKARFKQVLLNLLSNAIKYNIENGKVTIDCLLSDKNMLCLSISDTGKGLTSEQKSHLFKPFDRAGAEGSSIAGTGLGLVITKDLIEQMNGTIGFESEVGKGSRFWIQIPYS